MRGLMHATLERGRHWGPRSISLEGHTAGCIEQRAKFFGHCEFDGKLSAVHFRARVLLFARSNTARGGGGRHVQVTESSADSAHDPASWSRFRLVNIPGIAAGSLSLVSPSANVYFLNVQVWRDVLFGFFPAVLPPSSKLPPGIYATSSLDGVHWARPQLLVRTRHICDRTLAHPVGLQHGWLYVMDNIDQSEPSDYAAGHSVKRSAPQLLRFRLEVNKTEYRERLSGRPVHMSAEDSATAVYPLFSIDGQTSVDISTANLASTPGEPVNVQRVDSAKPIGSDTSAFAHTSSLSGSGSYSAVDITAHASGAQPVKQPSGARVTRGYHEARDSGEGTSIALGGGTSRGRGPTPVTSLSAGGLTLDDVVRDDVVPSSSGDIEMELPPCCVGTVSRRTRCPILEPLAPKLILISYILPTDSMRANCTCTVACEFK